MWLRTWMMMWKEYVQISRDPRMLTVVIVIPMMIRNEYFTPNLFWWSF